MSCMLYIFVRCYLYVRLWSAWHFFTPILGKFFTTAHNKTRPLYCRVLLWPVGAWFSGNLQGECRGMSKCKCLSFVDAYLILPKVPCLLVIMSHVEQLLPAVPRASFCRSCICSSNWITWVIGLGSTSTWQHSLNCFMPGFCHQCDTMQLKDITVI